MAIQKDRLDVFFIKRLEDGSAFSQAPLCAKNEECVVHLSGHKPHMMGKKLLSLFQSRCRLFHNGIMEEWVLFPVGHVHLVLQCEVDCVLSVLFPVSCSAGMKEETKRIAVEDRLGLRGFAVAGESPSLAGQPELMAFRCLFSVKAEAHFRSSLMILLDCPDQDIDLPGVLL